MDSILTSIKKMLGIEQEYTHFDTDIIMYINSTLSILTQLGVGSAQGFTIKDESALWTDFIPDNAALEFVKSYLYMKVKLLFDPPISSAVIEALNRMLGELEWRIHVAIDSTETNTEGEFQNG